MRVPTTCALHLLVALLAAAGQAATPAREAHGSSDVFVMPGVVLAWGVLRGADEASTKVVIRIDADPGSYAFVSVAGVDPFTQARRVLLPPTALRTAFDFASPRSRFVDFPRTELRFYAAASAVDKDAPALIVYYLGAPDTTPEFPAEAQLQAYLAQRVANARREPHGKSP